jgi:sugar phosphate isomerase/epimerase
MTLLLTLAIQSLNPLIESGKQDILEVPGVSSELLGLRGVMIDAKHLSGWGQDSYDRFRNNGDKAKSPCLLVRDNTSMDLVGAQEASRERIQRLSIAANRLGCNAISITPTFPDEKSSVDQIVEQLRAAMAGVERLELNLLLQPCEGLSSNPDELIEIIKQIGGFRIGALPTFSAAGSTGDGLEALRKLAPYAGGIVADFPTGRGKKNIDPVEGLKAVREVGYSNTVAINYLGKGDAFKEIDKVAKKMRKYLEDEK